MQNWIILPLTCAKHIEIDCYLVRERIHYGDFTLSYITLKSQPTDIFMKTLGTRQFQYLRSKLGMINLHALTWGGVLWEVVIVVSKYTLYLI